MYLKDNNAASRFVNSLILFTLSRTSFKSTLPIQEELCCRTGLGILVNFIKTIFLAGWGKESTVEDGVIHVLNFTGCKVLVLGKFLNFFCFLILVIIRTV